MVWHDLRDLIVYLLWNKGLMTNEELGRLFKPGRVHFMHLFHRMMQTFLAYGGGTKRHNPHRRIGVRCFYRTFRHEKVSIIHFT